MSHDRQLDVFVSYSHRDKAWLERVQVHLKPLARDGQLELWDDTRIKAGDRWQEEIEGALARADVAILLISPDFCASDFIAKNELPPLLHAAQGAHGLTILSVHISFSDHGSLSEYQAVNTPDRPIKSLRADQRDRIFLKLARRVRELTPLKATAPPEIPKAYLDWLAGKCASVELLGQNIQQGQAITLSQVYVPAITLPAAEASPGKAGPKVDEEDKRPTLLLQRLDEASLFVSAAAGAGKTTFCRWAALQSITGAPTEHPVPPPEGFEEPVPTELQTRLPLVVRLREFAIRMDCGGGARTWCRTELEQALADWIDRAPPDGLSGTLVRDHLKAGSAFLLLDGLDEVPPSETRDGVTVYPRELLLSGLADALPTWEKAGNRTLLTSRPYGLDEAGLARLGLDHAPLDPLPEPLQELFVTRWFHTLQKGELAGQVLEAMQTRSDLGPLVENPLLLTAVCVLYDNNRRLPEDRYELYESIIKLVLFARFPEAREREPVRARLEAIALGMHTGEANGTGTRKAPVAEVSRAEAERLLGDFADLNPVYETGRVTPSLQCDELLARSGLLLPRADGQAAFYHLSLQEFLAAERLARTIHDPEPVFKKRGPVPEWRPTLLFLFAALIGRDANRGLDLLMRLLAKPKPLTRRSNPAPAVLIAEALDLCLAKGYRIPEKLREAFQQLALGAIENEVELQARQTMGLVLGRLSDPRLFDLRDPRAYVEIPAGTYPYGGEGETIEIATPFRLGRSPVTNAQYRAFIEKGGYAERTWWSSAGWAWLQDEKVTEPWFWRDRRFNAPNQALVGVSFWEAEAFAKWAGGRLPTEQEWEAAAGGTERRKYPWGDGWKDGICNTREAGLGGTSPVGLFPGSKTPDGLVDMAGNVYEWCQSLSDEAEDAGEPNAPRVVRGGSWLNDQDLARCALRLRLDPSYRNYNLGFRVVCSSPITSSGL